MHLSIVDLPAPFAPTRATISPGAIDSDTPRRTGTPPWPAYRSRIRSPGSGAKVRLDHPWIPRDLRGRSLRDHSTRLQHHHALADRHDDFHHVLDEQQGDASQKAILEWVDLPLPETETTATAAEEPKPEEVKETKTEEKAKAEASK